MRVRVVLLVILTTLTLPATADAERGVAVDLGLVEIDRPLRAGETYRLPTLGVRNPGTETARYAMGLGQTDASGVSSPESAWFTFSPSEFELEPGQTVPVSIGMRLPTDVEPGAYEGLLRAELVAEGEGALVGAAAAARLTFDVAPSSSIEASGRAVVSMLTGAPAWSYALALALAAIVVVRVALRRFAFRVERRR